MDVKVYLAAVVTVSFVSPIANAASVTNLDKIPRTLTIEENGKRQDHSLNPGDVLDKICLGGCIIHLGAKGSDPYEVQPTDITTIEDGLLWGEDFDQPAIPPAAAPPDAKSPRR